MSVFVFLGVGALECKAILKWLGRSCRNCSNRLTNGGHDGQSCSRGITSNPLHGSSQAGTAMEVAFVLAGWDDWGVCVQGYMVR